MEITPLRPNETPQSLLGAGVGGNIMGQDDFLLLLVTQLGNQDPLNPMDGQEFAAQLAQFSSLEQLIGIGEGVTQNGELSSLLAQGVNSGVAAGLIGKEIEAYGNQMQFEGDELPINFELGGLAETLTIEIKDELGSVVRTIELNNVPEGLQEISWDGKNDDGNTVAQGTYTFDVTAIDKAEAAVEVTSFIRGQVDRVTFGREGIQLWIGDTAVIMGDVRSVGELGES